MNQYSHCKVCGGEVRLINIKNNLGECKNCKIIFCLSMFSQEDFVAVYDNLYNKDNSHYERHSKDEFNKILNGHSIKVGYNRTRLIKKTVLNGKCKSVLEIGSGVGFIGVFIRNHNETIKYTGVELDKEAFEKSKILNLNTINGDFSVIEKIELNFDVIMMWEVIEHLQDLKLFLELANKKLNINGKIILSTPNFNKIYNYPNREEDQIFQDLPPIHLNFFTPQNIKNIFELHGFKNCIVNKKKLPYLQVTSIMFYLNILKSFFNKYQGTTIYFEATKK